MPLHGFRNIEERENMINRPFESSVFSGGFNFSHGHLIKNAGYDKAFDFVFNWEEPY